MNEGLSSILARLRGLSAVDRLPALFVGHGSPLHALEVSDFSRAWVDLGAALPRPRAVVCVSAHWVTHGVSEVLAAVRPRTIHDFGGFDARLFDVVYAAPGAPGLAQRVRDLAGVAGFEVGLDVSWGLDHGAWAFLLHMFPDADVPVIELSVDLAKSPREHWALARALAPLRDEGVLFVASGNVVHNLRRVVWSADAPVFDWARDFDEAVRAALVARDVGRLLDFERWPNAALAHPSVEHFMPLLYALGVWDEAVEPLGFFNEGLELGSLSMRSMVFG